MAETTSAKLPSTSSPSEQQHTADGHDSDMFWRLSKTASQDSAESSDSTVSVQSAHTVFSDTTLEIREYRGQAKIKHIDEIFDELETNLTSQHLSTSKRKVYLEQIKVYGRDPRDAGAIYTKRGFEILTKYGFNDASKQSSAEALRAIANAMLLVAPMRQVFVDTGCAPQAVERLKQPDFDSVFLAARIIFICTYDTNLNFDMLCDEHNLSTVINTQIARFAKHIVKKGKKGNTTEDEQAIQELCKLLYNMQNFYPHRAAEFVTAVPHVLSVLKVVEIPHPPVSPTFSALINVLLAVPFDAKSTISSLFPSLNHKVYMEKLINILDQAVAVHKPSQLEVNATPLLQLLRRMHEVAPEPSKKYMAWLLLPNDSDREEAIGTSNTLSSRLLKLSLAPEAPNLRQSISQLMFELSGKDANEFVQNIGYGFASGFLMNEGIEIPASAKEAYCVPSGEGEKKVPVNPITGQRLDREKKDEGPEMTDEQKEREAERLFVLFERLKATGVMNVKNPIEEAYRSGQFEKMENRVSEVDSDDELGVD